MVLWDLFAKQDYHALHHYPFFFQFHLAETKVNASHIIPWSKDKANRVNPRNGLCLNAIHDRAFDRGFLTITPDFIIKISKSVKQGSVSEAVQDFLLRYDGMEINKPARFLPDAKFLKYHNKNVFRA